MAANPLNCYNQLQSERFQMAAGEIGIRFGIFPSLPLFPLINKQQTFQSNQTYQLQQIHSNIVHLVPGEESLQQTQHAYTQPTQMMSGDALVSKEKDKVLVVKTADCLPIVCFDRVSKTIGVIHAGRKGLVLGIIENTIDLMQSNNKSKNIASNMMFSIGPAICQDHYEIDHDVYLELKFKADFVNSHENCFKQLPSGKYLADLKLLACAILLSKGVAEENIAISSDCTYEKDKGYASYRRDKVTNPTNWTWITRND